jgi:hypothetical protein
MDASDGVAGCCLADAAIARWRIAAILRVPVGRQKGNHGPANHEAARVAASQGGSPYRMTPCTMPSMGRLEFYHRESFPSQWRNHGVWRPAVIGPPRSLANRNQSMRKADFAANRCSLVSNRKSHPHENIRRNRWNRYRVPIFPRTASRWQRQWLALPDWVGDW